MRDRRSPARGFAVFVIAWLNLVLAPCAMAQAGQHDCAHCPPEDGRAMSAHDGHAEAEAKNPCATLQAECCELAAATLDNRGADNGTARKAQLESCDAAPAYAELQPAPRAAACIATNLADPPTYTHPPRHVLNCVYLD